jgi:hypothetical protein
MLLGEMCSCLKILGGQGNDRIALGELAHKAMVRTIPGCLPYPTNAFNDG